ncbi:hypothetical protein HOB87_10115 [Candidatus Woesearchaeota archaeon]|jgi:hypothetical protein|nr:hypothetical protein [Candidatus Woesearchaeota archaeon]
MTVDELGRIRLLITSKLKGRMVRKNSLVKIMSNTNANYSPESYKLVSDLMIKHKYIIEKDDFIRLKETEDYTKLFTEVNGEKGIWVSKA